jgi:WXG100 protein secretion system (Wss), protein YukD
MPDLLVTVEGPAGRLDLAVPAEAPVADLLAPVAEALGVTCHGKGHGGWTLGLLGGDLLPAGESLVASGVRDGDVLVLGATAPAVASPVAPWPRPSDAPGRGWDPVSSPSAGDPPRAPIIAVPPAASGLAETTATTLLAEALATRTGQLTVIIDAHPPADLPRERVTPGHEIAAFGQSVQGAKGVASGRPAPAHEVTAADLLALTDHPALTREELLGLLTWCGPRLGLVAGRPGRGPPLADRDWRRLLRGLARHGLTLVVDCPAGPGHPATRAVVATADQLVLLVEPQPSPATRLMARALADRGLPVVALSRRGEVGRVAEVLVADWPALGLGLGLAAPSPGLPSAAG